MADDPSLTYKTLAVRSLVRAAMEVDDKCTAWLVAKNNPTPAAEEDAAWERFAESLVKLHSCAKSYKKAFAKE